MVLGYFGLIGCFCFFLFLCAMFYQEIIVDQGTLDLSNSVSEILLPMAFLAGPYFAAALMGYILTGNLAFMASEIA